ncbi:MAG: hypothetical protein IJ302_08885, partial [Clostridia bacterium]|nr:hypothetical protein [Clostridia bacterium]
CVLLLLCGCSRDALLLPTGGYDYRMSAIDGAILGYAIPRTGNNPYTVSAAAETLPPAFAYDSDRMEYAPLPVESIPLRLPQETVSVPCAVWEEGRVFFAGRVPDNIEIAQGVVSDCAVVLAEGNLYLADEEHAEQIANAVSRIFAVHTELPCILFSGADGLLYEYNDGRVSAVSGNIPVSDAWYALAGELHTVVFCAADGHTSADASGWYYTEDSGSPVPAQLPQTATEDARRVFVRDTVCILQGNNDTAYFYDIRTGTALDMDMGGLYRFPAGTQENIPAVTLTVSPDGMFVYLYDIDFIYRLNLLTGTLDLAYNEAPIYEGKCVLSSMTAVTDEIVLLSQPANEYTEYVPTITCAVFEEDIPEVRHEDDKIVLDYHPWETDGE